MSNHRDPDAFGGKVAKIGLCPSQGSAEVPMQPEEPDAGTVTSKGPSEPCAMADYEHIEPHRAREILPRAIWGPYLREGTLAVLGGESKARKSWFGLSLAMATVAGDSFLGIPIRPPTESHREVELLDFELLEANVMSRFLALSERHEDDDERWRAIWDRIRIRCHRSMLAEHVPWIEYCCAVIRDMRRGDLVIVDCLQALPVEDHSNPREIRRVLGMLQAAATESGACVLVVDHFNKSIEAKGKNRLSGSMAKAATPDSILLLESDGPFIRFSADLRMDPPRDPITLEFNTPSEGFRVVEDGEREARVEAGESARRNEIDREHRELLFPVPMVWRTMRELLAASGKTRKTVEGWLARIEGVEINREPKEHLYRYVPPTCH